MPICLFLPKRRHFGVTRRLSSDSKSENPLGRIAGLKTNLDFSIKALEAFPASKRREVSLTLEGERHLVRITARTPVLSQHGTSGHKRSASSLKGPIQNLDSRPPAWQRVTLLDIAVMMSWKMLRTKSPDWQKTISSGLHGAQDHLWRAAPHLQYPSAPGHPPHPAKF